MIKVKKDNLIFLGLSDNNMRAMMEDKPIKFKLSELKLSPDQKLDDLEVVIFNGKDESTMLQMFVPHIGPDTEVG